MRITRPRLLWQRHTVRQARGRCRKVRLARSRGQEEAEHPHPSDHGHESGPQVVQRGALWSAEPQVTATILLLAQDRNWSSRAEFTLWALEPGGVGDGKVLTVKGAGLPLLHPVPLPKFFPNPFGEHLLCVGFRAVTCSNL